MDATIFGRQSKASSLAGLSSAAAGFGFDETGAARHLTAELQRKVDEKFRCVRTDVTPLGRTANGVHGIVDVQVNTSCFSSHICP